MVASNLDKSGRYAASKSWGVGRPGIWGTGSRVDWGACLLGGRRGEERRVVADEGGTCAGEARRSPAAGRCGWLGERPRFGCIGRDLVVTSWPSGLAVYPGSSLGASAPDVAGEASAVAARGRLAGAGGRGHHRGRSVVVAPAGARVIMTPRLTERNSAALAPFRAREACPQESLIRPSSAGSRSP